jgi:hypothetical protein
LEDTQKRLEQTEFDLNQTIAFQHLATTSDNQSSYSPKKKDLKPRKKSSESISFPSPLASPLPSVMEFPSPLSSVMELPINYNALEPMEYRPVSPIKNTAPLILKPPANENPRRNYRRSFSQPNLKAPIPPRVLESEEFSSFIDSNFANSDLILESNRYSSIASKRLSKTAAPHASKRLSKVSAPPRPRKGRRSEYKPKVPSKHVVDSDASSSGTSTASSEGDEGDVEMGLSMSLPIETQESPKMKKNAPGRESLTGSGSSSSFTSFIPEVRRGSLPGFQFPKKEPSFDKKLKTWFQDSRLQG